VLPVPKDDNCLPDVKLLGVTAFSQVIAKEEVVKAIAIQLGEGQALQEAVVEGITEGERYHMMLNA